MIRAEQTSERCLVITTHSMEEADALCGRIGIMAGGGLRCLGTQLHLKSTFGDGFKVTCSTRQPDATNPSLLPAQARLPPRRRVSLAAQQQRTEIDTLMRSLSPDSKLVGVFAQQSTYTLPGCDVANIFSVLEEAKRNGVVVEWGISQASLEDVFIKVVTKFEEDQARRHEEVVSEDGAQEDDGHP